MKNQEHGTGIENADNLYGSSKNIEVDVVKAKKMKKEKLNGK